MRETTRRQIEAMKNQTFGVEVEMFNITRENAAKAAAEYFGTGRYEYTAWTNGYQTWSAWDAQGREWKFQRDASIRARVDAEKCEMVTPILRYEDMETLQEVVRVMRRNGGRSNPRHECGVHVHIGADGHTPRSLKNLVNLMASHEDLLIDAIHIDRGRTTQWCKTVDPAFLKSLNLRKPTTMDALADVWYESHDGANWNRGEHYNPSRYHMLNLHATFTKGTIEFRLFQFNNPHGKYKGGLHAGRLKSYIQLCLALSQMAKQCKNCRPNKPQVENPKYAMRTWLLRLGFIGDEFATAREFLTRDLAGNAAWRQAA